MTLYWVEREVDMYNDGVRENYPKDYQEKHWTKVKGLIKAVNNVLNKSVVCAKHEPTF